MIPSLALLLLAQVSAIQIERGGGSGDSGGTLDDGASQITTPEGCRCYPGDACWPTLAEWQDFNDTIGGRLVATVPLASACHHDDFAAYSADACEAVQAVWPIPETHWTSSSSVMASFFANSSCNAFTPPSSRCVLGTYVRYAVNATGAADYQNTLGFAAQRNLRLVIRNTGHDFLGKSTGAGALALWTHHLKDIDILADYSSAAYSGPALRMAAGVQAFEAYAAADAAGLVVVGGNCDTVGMAGGYTQGGGLGPLVSTFGLGADQVLEWEVVTALGEHIVATAVGEYSDLYWALSGGGGGTYAAVLSMTVRAHSTMRVASATLTFAISSGDAVRGVIETFLTSLPSIADAGSWASFYLIDGFFELVPVFSPNLGAQELQNLLNPVLEALNETGIPYDYYIGEFDTFLSAYDTMIPTDNVTNYNTGGRLMPRSLFETNDSVASLMDVFQYIMDAGGAISGIVSTQSDFPRGNLSNAVNPAFRSSLVDVVIGLTYNDTDFAANFPARAQMTNTILPKLEALSPGGGAYLNEGDANQPDWQQVFYGDNYERLEKIKEKYDPDALFYALTAVGSEKWEYRMDTDGRLCRI